MDPARFGDLNVYFNDDWESYNYNYSHNIEAQAQDKLIVEGMAGGVEDAG
jgi:hypothetical protein